MVEKGEIVESDLVVVEGSSSWVQAKHDPVLRLLFVRGDTKANRSPERHTAKQGRRINLIAGVVRRLVPVRSSSKPLSCDSDQRVYVGLLNGRKCFTIADA
jgi:hypothetical protein